MEKEDILKILAVLTGSAIIVGGLIVDLSTKTQPMTYEEYQLLLKIYNYEIQQAGGRVDLADVNKNNVITKLNERLSQRAIKATTTIEGVELSPVDYQNLKTGLFKKAEIQ